MPDQTIFAEPAPAQAPAQSDRAAEPEQHPRAVRVCTSDDELTVQFQDGRTISVPLRWYPRLEQASSEERQNWELIGNGTGIHWPAIDDDTSGQQTAGSGHETELSP